MPPPARRTARRVGALLLLATTVVAATIVLRSLGESGAQLRALFNGAAATRSTGIRTEHAPAVVPQRGDVPAPAAQNATETMRAEAVAPVAPPALEAESPPAAGPISGDEFVRLLESGVLPENDPEAVEELRRALRAGAP